MSFEDLRPKGCDDCSVADDMFCNKCAPMWECEVDEPGHKVYRHRVYNHVVYDFTLEKTIEIDAKEWESADSDTRRRMIEENAA